MSWGVDEADTDDEASLAWLEDAAPPSRFGRKALNSLLMKRDDHICWLDDISDDLNRYEEKFSINLAAGFAEKNYQLDASTETTDRGTVVFSFFCFVITGAERDRRHRANAGITRSFTHFD